MSTIEEVSSMMDGIPEWFAGKNIFITGGTGFLGKVLVEKLLRSCPDFNCMYLLIRPKKGVDPLQRKKEYFQNPLFEKTLKNNPKIIEKVRVIKGDIVEEELGISENDRNELISNVNIVFHGAATVRFDQHIRVAVEINLGGSLRMLQLAEKMKNLEVFVHVSTTYSQCNEDSLEERAYAPPNDPFGILQLVRVLDDKFLEKITPKLLCGFPNTYSYTKSLTEAAVNTYGHKLPIVVGRPAIITPVFKEPIPGWVEGLNGPTGLMVGAARGVVRTMHCNPDYYTNIIPVDTVSNAVIAIAWDRAHMKSDKVEYFNIVAPQKYLITWGESIETGKRLFHENPLEYSLWYPDGSVKKNYYHHMICLFFFHLIPAYFIDAILLILGKKRFMVRIQKKISAGLDVLQYYTTKQWNFKYEKLDKLRSKLNLRDQDNFDFTIEQINYEQYIYNYILGTRQYVVKESKETIPQSRKLLRQLYILHCVTKFLFYGLIFWYLWTRMDAIVETAEFLFGISTKFFTPQSRYILERSG